MRLPPLPTIKDILRLYKIRALKSLSQNFILNERIANKFVRAAGSLKDHHVIEVGPGPGSITRSILNAHVSKVTVIEKDSRFLPTLDYLKEASDVPLEIVLGDILFYDMTQSLHMDLVKPWISDPPNIHIIGNLPFNVSTPLIVKLLRQISSHTGPWAFGRVRMTLSFQKEVGERMIARVNSDQRSRLTIMTQYLCHVKLQDVIPGTAFLPKPDVDVAVVSFEPRVEPLIADVPFDVVEKVVSHIFHHKNKIFKNCISTLFPPDRVDLIEELGNRSEIGVETVPRTITMAQFSRLCQVYQEICARDQRLFEYDYRSKKNVSEWRRRTVIWQQIHGDDYYTTPADTTDTVTDTTDTVTDTTTST